MRLISTITTIFANRHKRAALLSLLALLFPAPCFAQDEEMSFRRLAAKSCHASCPAEIAADGIITKDSADAFRVVAKIAVPAAIVVHLASPGGSLVGSLQLGEAFREFNTTVIVGNGARCTSACVYALLGGAARRVTGGRVGVHRFRPENESDQNFPPVLVQRAAEVLTQYVAHMGANPALVGLAMDVSPPAVHFLGTGELRRYRVID